MLMEKFLERLQSVLSLRVSAELSPAGLAGELVLKTGDVLQELLVGALQHLRFTTLSLASISPEANDTLRLK